MQTMLNGGHYGNVTLFDQSTVDEFTRSSAADVTFGLGWRVNGNSSMTPTFGVLASPQTYGHTGWTGTLTAIDPVNVWRLSFWATDHTRPSLILK